MKLIISRPWHGPTRIYQPGEYSIPGHFTRAIAKCCVIEGCGEIVTEAAATGSDNFRDPAKERDAASPKLERKKPAPANKSRGPAPKNKATVE